MKKVAEVFEHECFNCHKSFQFIMRPNDHLSQPVLMLDDHIMPNMPDFKTSCLPCPNCGLNFVVIGELISLVDDMEDFNEIEQHR